MTTSPYTKIFLGIVNRVIGPAVGAPADISYEVLVIPTEGEFIPPITDPPTVRRHGGFSAKVVAARQGDPCVVTMQPTGEFQIFPLTEYTAFKPCNGEGGGDGSGDDSTGGGPPPPPPPGGPNTKAPPGGGIGGGPVSEF